MWMNVIWICLPITYFINEFSIFTSLRIPLSLFMEPRMLTCLLSNTISTANIMLFFSQFNWNNRENSFSILNHLENFNYPIIADTWTKILKNTGLYIQSFIKCIKITTLLTQNQIEWNSPIYIPRCHSWGQSPACQQGTWLLLVLGRSQRHGWQGWHHYDQWNYGCRRWQWYSSLLSSRLGGPTGQCRVHKRWPELSHQTLGGSQPAKENVHIWNADINMIFSGRIQNQSTSYNPVLH